MANDLVVATHNLRLDLAVDGENRFQNRIRWLPDYWKFLNADLFGFQEVTPPMMEAIKQAMPAYELIGNYRSEGAEACPIAYRRDRFALLSAKTVWLTDTPHVFSKDPESKYPRIATIAVLKDATGSTFQIVNTHLDYASDAVAKRQIGAAMSCIDESLPTIVTGDFNVAAESDTCRSLESLGYRNVGTMFGLTGATFHNFSERLEGLPIDHVFASKHWRPESATIDRNRPANGYYSDHDPVIVRFRLTA